jgi:hypothetical protein
MFQERRLVMPELLETVMVISFGVSWPVSILKSFRARSSKGKSLLFLCCILVGYLCGVAAKVIGGNLSYVLVFYCLNSLMVLTDIGLYLRNRKLEKG